jgi:hypothetical protein
MNSSGYAVPVGGVAGLLSADGVGAVAFAAMRPDLDAWEPWHPKVLAQRLAGLPVPWYVAAGWALDLFRGRQDPRPRRR